jgi:hypothetical protein
MSKIETAHIEVLTAEVRTLMVGSRQVTLSVYRQLDWASPDQCEPFGRVRDSKDDDFERTYIVGRGTTTGSLIRSSCWPPRASHEITTAPLKNWWEPTNDSDGWLSYKREHSVFAWITQENDDFVFWNLFYESVHTFPHTPHRWKYQSPEIEKEAIRLAQKELADLRETRKIYAEWNALPLIVLAGLR